MTDKTVNEATLEHILLCRPGARIEIRDGTEYLLIPEYDFDNDKTTWIERCIVRGKQGPKPGDTLRHETGASFKIADLPSILFGKVVKRDDPDGNA